MSSLPSEVLEDVLQPLDRWTFDDVQFTSRRFLQLILGHMSDVCLRPIDGASFRVNYKEDAHLRIRIDSRPEREVRRENKNVAELFSEFVQALRSSRVEHLTLACDGHKGFVFTPSMATLFLETPIIARRLALFMGSYAELTPTEFRELVLHVSPSSVHLSRCDLRPSQISDEFLRALFTSGVRRTRIEPYIPDVSSEEKRPDAFHVTDDAIVEFLAQEDDHTDQEHEAGELFLPHGSFTKDLFKRLVEASAASTRERRLLVWVAPVRFEDGDLRDFEQHLSYSYNGRGQRRENRIYDFPGEIPPLPGDPDEEEPSDMHLQIVLHPSEHILELQRARFPWRFWQ